MNIKMIRNLYNSFNKSIMLTPGPLNCHPEIKNKMLKDYGSRDKVFLDIVKNIREKLLLIASCKDNYTTILIPGSGTYGIESVISSLPKDSQLAVFSNGAYGRRIANIAEINNMNHVHVAVKENQIITPELVKHTLDSNSISHVAAIHHETTTGILNPIEDIGQILKDKVFIVDAMSSFGGIHLDIEKSNIDFLVSSPNKCFESVPGFSYVIADKESLNTTKGHERSLSLSLYLQWFNLEEHGQFRFTPPTHSLVAFDKALDLFLMGGGIEGRSQRYTVYNTMVKERMENMGFESYLKEHQGYIISTFKYPTDDFDFDTFYERLNKKNVIIYPGKLSEEKVFRIGNIGDINYSELNKALNTIENVYQTMN